VSDLYTIQFRWYKSGESGAQGALGLSADGIFSYSQGKWSGLNGLLLSTPKLGVVPPLIRLRLAGASVPGDGTGPNSRPLAKRLCLIATVERWNVLN